MTGVPTVNVALLAVLDIVKAGTPGAADTLLLTELVQWAAAGQVVSPPPLTLAVLVSVVPAAAAVGIAGMAKELTPPAARPAATVQFTA